MAATVQGACLVRRIIEQYFKGLQITEKHGTYFAYKFSGFTRELRMKRGTKYRRTIQEIEDSINKGNEILHGRKIIVECNWIDLLRVTVDYDVGLQIYEGSMLPIESIEPEEEFLRNYKRNLEVHEPMEKFVEMRAKNETQVYGDLPLKVWYGFIEEYSTYLNHTPAGLKMIRCFLTKYGSPFSQSSRDLAKFENINVCYTTPLIFEMCLMESILEFNLIHRMREENLKNLEFGDEPVNGINLIREFFYVCIPHPKKINNMLRSPYTWFVKMWGVGANQLQVLRSYGSDDRNSKDIFYEKFITVNNKYEHLIKNSLFYKKSKLENIDKIKESVKYSQDIGKHCEDIKTFLKLINKVYFTPFIPSKISNVILASLLLSIQTMTGYGRAWVKNVGTDEAALMKPSKENLINEVSDYTKNNFIKAYDEAKKRGEEIVKPENLYTSMLRLARNTSSGFSTEIMINKMFGPTVKRQKELIKIHSRIKALVIFTKGHTVFTPEELHKKYNTVLDYQTKGSRDVPIKSTRTIYSINLSVLIPQLVLTLPLNEYFSRVGGSTHPDYPMIGGKIIVGDLEATGSRVVDAADTFRNSSDGDILTIAIDYSDYDTHLTQYNFRGGMLSGLKEVVKQYENYRYEGFTLEQLIEFGYGEGRVARTLWNGKRKVVKVSSEAYMMLDDIDREVREFKPPIGVHPVSTGEVLNTLIKKTNDSHNCILVSPTDGSDLALVSTHLSGENSTLVANSMHNMAIGTLIQDNINKQFTGKLSFLSEQYVGDDTLFYCKLHTYNAEEFNNMITNIFDTVKKCGHVASESKTMITPYSVEKTQTHAKQGIYIPQDRMMIISSERRKDIEDVQGYMRSQIHTMVTKVSRGFSHELATNILMLKTSFIGAWKMKRTVLDEKFRDRIFDSDEEDGFTLIQIRDPLTLFIPVAWNGYGAHPAALNIVMSEDIFIDSQIMPHLDNVMKELLLIANSCSPHWNETEADSRQVMPETKMSFFSKMARPVVQLALNNAEIMSEVEKLPLGDFSPNRISRTMMHSALLKEQSARTLLTGGYELEYQNKLNGWLQNNECGDFIVNNQTGEITTNFSKLFNITYGNIIIEEPKKFPDQNLSPAFFLQKASIGQRMSTRLRMSYIDRIDSILRKDVVMRGFITANTIINVLEKVGNTHTAIDLTTLFCLMNIEFKVAEELAMYLTSEKVRFDALKLLKRGMCGDEFSMSLNVATQHMIDTYVQMPHEFTKTEGDVMSLYISQLIMLRCALGLQKRKIQIHADENMKQRYKLRVQRFKIHAPRLRLIKKLIDINRLSVRQLENQFT
uniref:RNA-directed RNA polymerase n=1 Tax=Changuinola virus TaxID=40052 RepID=U5YLB4_9REOV|nr:RNA polymerase VP1 [Changuinola virus]AGZ92013.1 RNA polymerase VP1 [Changuinola virus]